MIDRSSLRSSSAWSLKRAALLSATVLAALALGVGAAAAQTQALGYAPARAFPGESSMRPLALHPMARAVDEADEATGTQLPERLRRAVVAYDTREAPGSIVIDTANTALYYVLGHGRAIRYGVGVGREGFTWSGVETISRKAEWPDWHPPASMIARQPYLPRFVAGGPGNPLGARAMYLGNSEYRIHGTNDPSTIGKFVSSGCIRLTNADVEDLFSRVTVGTRVVVLPKRAPQHIEARGLDRVPAAHRAVPRGQGEPRGAMQRQALNLVPARAH
jgi:lipoprotein-anchoring transpeptidase ErfK/SrfK